MTRRKRLLRSFSERHVKKPVLRHPQRHGVKEKGAAEDEMAAWRHRLDGHELGQSLGDGEGQGGLACSSLWSRRESDTTGRLNTGVQLVFCP